MNNSLSNKLYYSISEVAELTGLQPYTLRAWEKEFACLRPRRARGKNRAYRERDIGVIMILKQLLYEERYTTQGVKLKLKNEPELLRNAADHMPEMVSGPGPGAAAGDGQVEMPEEGVAAVAAAPGALSGARAAEIRRAIEEARRELSEILQLL